MSEQVKYLSSLIFPLCVLWFVSTGPHESGEAMLWTLPLWLLIIADWLSPQISDDEISPVASNQFYNLVLYALAFLQFAIIYLLLLYASSLQWGTVDEVMTSLVNLLVMRILVGTSSGSSAIIVAHELIHRTEKHLRLLGRLLLYTVCYEHFVIAHLRGHHHTVATVDDIATARLGESFDTYWRRVLVGHFKYAWSFELERLGLTNMPVYHYKMLENLVLQGIIIEAILLLIIGVYFGWAAMLIFLYQALSAVRLLETINYYQHWGLVQGKVDNHLAWVNQSIVTQYALIGLSHHVAHHHNSKTAFYQTPFSKLGPMMPYGYFVTNLWVKLNNESYKRVSIDILKRAVYAKEI